MGQEEDWKKSLEGRIKYHEKQVEKHTKKIKELKEANEAFNPLEREVK